MKNTAAWCKECDRPVWLPHEEHTEALIVEYDSGRRPFLPFRRPRHPSIVEIKQYRNRLAADKYTEGSLEEAILIFEGLLTFVGREHATYRERLLDHTVLGNLAECLMETGEFGKATAVLSRAPLESPHLDGTLKRCLGLRALCYVRMGQAELALVDHHSLYAQDARHPLLIDIEREIALSPAKIWSQPGSASRQAR